MATRHHHHGCLVMILVVQPSAWVLRRPWCAKRLSNVEAKASLFCIISAASHTYGAIMIFWHSGKLFSVTWSEAYVWGLFYAILRSFTPLGAHMRYLELIYAIWRSFALVDAPFVPLALICAVWRSFRSLAHICAIWRYFPFLPLFCAHLRFLALFGTCWHFMPLISS